MNKYWSVIRGKSYEAMRLYVEEVVHHSYPINSILSRLHDEILRNDEIKDVNKALICEKIAKVLYIYNSDHLIT